MQHGLSDYRRGAAVAGLICALTAPLAAQAQTDNGRCEMKLIGELPVTLENNRPIIAGTINGKPVKILASTGSDASSVSEATAKAFGLKVVTDDSIIVYTADRKSRLSSATTVESFGLGASTVKNQRFMVLSGPTGYVVLGRAFWSSADVEFDLAHNVIRLFRPLNCAGKPLAYWGPDHGVAAFKPGYQPGESFVVEVMLNGRPVGAEIESGRSTSIVTTDVSAAAGVVPGSAAMLPQEAVKMGGGRVEPTWIATFGSFAIADETIRNAKLRVSDAYLQVERTPLGSRVARADVFAEPQMALGADFLRSHRVLISNSQKKIYFSYVGGPVFQVTGPVGAAE